ncbi:MAG: patatin-like phospholipase family protein [Clostridia bacterium]|nr:patatin-like phospholipase family protein [Clostridia bacterium]
MDIFKIFKKNKDEKTNSMQIHKKVKIGLALGGGGVRGVGHIGALMAFEELGIHFDYIAGTSAGSIVGALYAFGKSPKEMKELALTLRKKDITRGMIPFIKPANTARIENILNSVFGDVKVFSELKIPFKAVCTDLKTGKEVDFDYGNVAKVVSASCAVPGVFTPVVYDDMHLVDGGLRNNVPADVVKNMGANVVFAIDVNHLRGTGTKSLSTVSVLSSVIGIIMQSKIDKTMEVADLIFEPALENFSPLKFDDIEEIIQIGYETVMANKDKIAKMLGLNPKRIGKYFTKNEN